MGPASLPGVGAPEGVLGRSGRPPEGNAIEVCELANVQRNPERFLSLSARCKAVSHGEGKSPLEPNVHPLDILPETIGSSCVESNSDTQREESCVYSNQC
jgi:hypothetical protein